MFWKKKEQVKYNKRLLFVLKRIEDYSCDESYTTSGSLSTGLYNSINFVVQALQPYCDTKFVVVEDNNKIDKEVHDYNPTDVIIEALWVVPDKMRLLSSLYPNINWIVRLHSEIPFLSQEGIAMEWLHEYDKMENVYIACNSPRACKSLYDIGIDTDTYLPNVYLLKNEESVDYASLIFKHNTLVYGDLILTPGKKVIDIGCFGAIRPLKNQLLQAMTAYRWCKDNGYGLILHINAGRVECGASPIYKNLINVFNGCDARIIAHEWMPHNVFLTLLRSMDMCMQVSLSETYNIVTADAVAMNIPVVVSKEIPFINNTVEDPCSEDEIYYMMSYVWNHKNKVVKNNLRSLENYNKSSIEQWKKFLA